MFVHSCWSIILFVECLCEFKFKFEFICLEFELELALERKRNRKRKKTQNPHQPIWPNPFSHAGPAWSALSLFPAAQSAQPAPTVSLSRSAHRLPLGPASPRAPARPSPTHGPRRTPQPSSPSPAQHARCSAADQPGPLASSIPSAAQRPRHPCRDPRPRSRRAFLIGHARRDPGAPL